MLEEMWLWQRIQPLIPQTLEKWNAFNFKKWERGVRKEDIKKIIFKNFQIVLFFLVLEIHQ